MPDLDPGNLLNDPEDFSDFYGSMAARIEQELDDLMALDGLPRLVMDDTDREVRDRRRFLVAIARGVVAHLVENADAFVVVHDGGTHTVDINSVPL